MIKAINFINLILYRSVSELRSEGSRTYISYLWWIIEPLMSLAVYYVAFKYIFHRQTEYFALFLFIGVVNYRFFSGTVTRSSTSITSGKGLMQLVYVHKSIFPLTVVAVNLIKFCITLLLVVAAVWLSGLVPSWPYLMLPVLIGLLLLFTAGVSMICAAITPFFPDFQVILNTLMHLLVFVSGVFFDVRQMPDPVRSMMLLNPLTVFNEQFRAVLLYRQWPDASSFWPGLIAGVVCLAVGGFLIHTFNRHFPKIG